jgi:hypothetical protein
MNILCWERTCFSEQAPGTRCTENGKAQGKRSWLVMLDLFLFWYIVVFPGAALLLFALGWNLIGDAFRDALDPKMRGSRLGG